METKFNFNSAICTDRTKSERLFALGLKIETADCYHWQETDKYGDGNGKWHCEILSEYNKDHNEYLYNVYGVDGSDEGFFIPAWSLDRLRELAICNIEMNIFLSKRCGWINKPHHDSVRIDRPGALFDYLINYIEWLIKEGYFNKEYLVNQNVTNE